MENVTRAWETWDVAGREVEVFRPATPASGCVLWLHDVDARSFRGQRSIEAAFAAEGLAVVAPAGGAYWWLDRPVAEFGPLESPRRFLLEHVLPRIAADWNFTPPQIAVAGLGMGGQGAVNLAFRHARQFPVVAAILPDIDFHQWYGQGWALDRMFPSQESARQQTATLHLHPLNWPRALLLVCDPADPRFEGTERLASKLTSSGIPFERDFEPRGNLDPWSYCSLVIPSVARFLRVQLEAVSRQL